MNKPGIPSIIESAKKRPLSLDPASGSFILYDEVLNGSKKIVRLEKLSMDQLINLAAERQLTDEPGITVILTGRSFTKNELATEILNQTIIGKKMFDVDINYLKFYLSQFPDDCFEK